VVIVYCRGAGRYGRDSAGERGEVGGPATREIAGIKRGGGAVESRQATAVAEQRN
jgi:hypothetical protein